MLIADTGLPVPPDDARVWRYLDFAKLRPVARCLTRVTGSPSLRPIPVT